jgi:HAD superfamily hydrolase (TIGR01509 family)
MSRPKLVIFDCDGVLVDTERIAVRVDAIVLARIGWPLTEAEVAERFVGHTDDYMRCEIQKHLGRQLAPDWDAEYLHLYREAFDAELQPVDGIVEALNRIRTLTCVASSGSHEKMRYTLGKTGLYERFAGRIFSAAEVLRGKPAPDLFLHAAAGMGGAPAACAVVQEQRGRSPGRARRRQPPFRNAGGAFHASYRGSARLDLSRDAGGRSRGAGKAEHRPLSSTMPWLRTLPLGGAHGRASAPKDPGRSHASPRGPASAGYRAPSSDVISSGREQLLAITAIRRGAPTTDPILGPPLRTQSRDIAPDLPPGDS